MYDSSSDNNGFLNNKNDFKSLISAASQVSIIATDEKGIIRLFNSGAEKMLGYKESEVVGKFTPEIFHLKSEIDERAKELSLNLVKGSGGLDFFSKEALTKGLKKREWTYIKKDGTHIFVSLSINPVFHDDGKIKGFLGIAVDISNNKRFEIALKRSEKTLRDMAENIPGILFQFYAKNNGERGFYYLSQRSRELLGIESGIDNIFEDFLDRVHKDFRDKLIASIEDSVKEKKRWFFEGKFLNYYDLEVWFQGIALPTRDEDETIFNGVLLDITDQKLAELKLKESEERFSLLVKASFGGIGIHERGKILDSNKGLSDITGYSIDELKGMDGLTLIAKEFRGLVKEKILSGYSKTYDVIGLKKDKTKYPLEIRGRNIPFQGKKLRVTEFRDITDRKKIEEYLKESEENIRATLNSIGEGVIGTDKSGKIVRMNPAAEKFTGFMFEDAFEKNINEIFFVLDEKGKRIEKDYIKEVIDIDDNIIFSGCSKLISKDEHITNVLCSGSPVKSSKGSITGAVIVIRDISHEFKLREELQHGRKLEAIGQLAGGVAHDFNNMLSGIMGASEILLARHPDDEKSVKYCKMIMDAAYRAGNLTSKLLAFARKGKIVSNPVNLHTIVKDAISLLKRSIDKKIIIKSEFLAEKNIIKGDPSQLENIFLNLGINSSHAMPGGGELKFSSRIVEFDERYAGLSPFNIEPGDFIEIEVKDTGTGIDHKHIDKIFEPYFTTKEQGRGTGLGLAAVYGIVQQHKGSVSVYSEKEKGTVFKIYLPVHDGEYKDIKDGLIKPVTGEGTILFIDDEELLRNVAKTILTSLGYNIILAENGKVGFEKFLKQSKEIDLVILDMIMPEMNGRECFYKIREYAPDSKIIISSGFSDDDDIEELKNSGISGFIRKPFKALEMSRLVSRVISK